MSLKTLWRLVVTQLWWRPRFGRIGSRTVLFKPIVIHGESFATIGESTQIREMARIEVITHERQSWVPALKIGNRVNIEQGVHIICQGQVKIEDDVSITPYCVIVDTYHPHDPPDILPKIGARLPDRESLVVVGQGTFVGAHSIILPNVKIGKGCVIGAGSVVTRDVPDYSVVVGSPARVIATFDRKLQKWSRCE